MLVEVVYLPPIATDITSKLCVVIDVLRATSTLVSMLDAGARTVVLSESIASALAYERSRENHPLLCGESGGLPPEGFDLGNSPREYRPDNVMGRDLVFVTSNGTRAMWQLVGAPVVLAGSLLNASSVARSALEEASQRSLDIALVCSGDFLGTRFAIDDAFCAGYLVTLIRKIARELLADNRQSCQSPHHHGATHNLLLDESAIAAARLYHSYLLEAGILDLESAPPREVILKAFWESHNAQVLRGVGLAEDVEYCAQLDISRRVPRLQLEQQRLKLV